MYKLEKLNVVRIVDSEYARDRLLEAGFVLVEEPDQAEAETADAAGHPEAIEPDQADAETMDIDGMTVKELQDHLTEHGIAFKAGMSKTELLKLAYQQ